MREDYRGDKKGGSGRMEKVGRGGKIRNRMKKNMRKRGGERKAEGGERGRGGGERKRLREKRKRGKRGKRGNRMKRRRSGEEIKDMYGLYSGDTTAVATTCY